MNSSSTVSGALPGAIQQRATDWYLTVCLTNRNVLLPAFAAIGLILGGAAMAIEEPAFEKLEAAENIEIRQYRPVIVAETFVDGDMSSASNKGFRLIADYIFGNYLSRGGTPDKPSEKIAMTAPVNVEPQGDSVGGVMHGKRWRVQFTMPGGYSMATLPKPQNPAVTLRELPGKRYAVLVFSGFSGEEKVQQKTDELLLWLKAKNKTAFSTPQLARYNPPWTLPFLRRNEILVEVAAP